MIEKFKTLSKGKKIIVGIIAFIFLPCAILALGVEILLKGIKSKKVGRILFGSVLAIFMITPSLTIINLLIGSSTPSNNTTKQEAVETLEESKYDTLTEENLGNQENGEIIKEDNSYSIKHGEFLSANINEDILVIKAKIEPNLNNKLTISQNGFNVEDIIKSQGGDQFNEIQYWAVADMTDGSESKVISFTLNKDLIDSVKSGDTPANQIIDKAADVWILPSLQN